MGALRKPNEDNSDEVEDYLSTVGIRNIKSTVLS